jgi:hypothetical protein
MRDYLNLSKITKRVNTHDLLLATLVALIVIICGLFLGWSNNKVFPSYPPAHYHYVKEPSNPLSFISNWDGPDYLDIVHSGYHTLFQANFFPLYPLLVYLVKFIVRSALDSALIVSWLSLVGALYFYIRIVKKMFGIRGLDDTVAALMFFILFPTAVFLFATYTESLYAMLSLGAIYYSLQKKYIYVAPLLLLCTATHITAPLVVLLSAMILWEQKVRLVNIIATAVVGCLGLVAYMVFLEQRFHNPLAFLKAQKQIHGWFHHSYLNLITSASDFNVLFIALLIGAAVYWWQTRKSFSVYCLLFLLIPLLGRQYGGFNRYVLMAFPIELMLSKFFITRKNIYPYALLVTGILWIFFTLQYAAGYIGS